MANYERVNEKNGRLFRATEDDIKKGRPLLNGPVVIDGILCYAGVYLKKGQNGKADYYTLSLQYPPDEQARLRATGPATSAAAAKEREWEANHPRTAEDARRKAEWRSSQASQASSPDPAADDGVPF